jgi:hypothetical protein
MDGLPNFLEAIFFIFPPGYYPRSQQTFNAMLRFERSLWSSHEMQSYFVW